MKLIIMLFILAVSCVKTDVKEADEKNIELAVEQMSFHKTVSVEQFMTLWDANKSDSKYVLIDVRTPSEFGAGHIAGAKNIDFNSYSFSSTFDVMNKNDTYFLYCRSDNRSGQAMKLMEKKKFTKVYNMKGGIISYGNLGYPLVK